MTRYDWETPFGRELRAMLEDELALLRSKNDAKGLDPIKTEYIRGEIARVKWMLALYEPTSE